MARVKPATNASHHNADMHIEELLLVISKSSPLYRWLLTILLSFLTMKSAFDMFVLNLATIPVPFHCNQIDVNNETLSWENAKLLLQNSSVFNNFTIMDYTCKKPVFTRLNNDVVLSNKSDVVCSAWTFVPDDPARWNMLMEYELVCDRQYLNDRFQTIFQAGIFVSSTLAPVADLVGRKIPILTAVYIDLGATILVTFVSDIYFQMVLRFLMSFGSPAVLTGIILLTEVIHEDYHGIHGNFYWLLWVVGYAGAGPIAYYIKNWRIQIVVIAIIIGSGYVTYYFVVPESPRWLVSRGKYKEAKQELTKIYKRVGLDETLLDSMDEQIAEDEADTKKPEVSFIPKENLCRTKYLVTEFVFTILLVANAIVYFASSFKRDFISKDPYVNVVISGVLELPAYFVGWILTNKCGRKYSNLVLFLSCGILLLILPFIPQPEDVLFGFKSFVALVSKFIITISFSITLIYASEALPTTIRTFSFCLSSQVMRLAQAFTPELGGILGKVSPQFPYFVYGGLAIIAGLAIIVIPETKDRPMPETLAEMQGLTFVKCGRSDSFEPNADQSTPMNVQTREENA